MMASSECERKGSAAECPALEPVVAEGGSLPGASMVKGLESDTTRTPYHFPAGDSVRSSMKRASFLSSARLEAAKNLITTLSFAVST